MLYRTHCFFFFGIKDLEIKSSQVITTQTMARMEEDLEASPSESSRLITNESSKPYQLDPSHYGKDNSNDINDSENENAGNVPDDKYRGRKIKSVLMVVVPFVLMAAVVVGKNVLNNHNSNDASAFWLGGPSFFNAKSEISAIFDSDKKSSKSASLMEVKSQKEVGSSSFDDDAVIGKLLSACVRSVGSPNRKICPTWFVWLILISLVLLLVYHTQQTPFSSTPSRRRKLLRN